MAFFKVTAKCGHVGARQYYRGLFYVQAEDGKTAAANVRMMPRVKHDRKDTIIAVEKIDYSAFQEGKVAYHKNPFFRCHSKQEQSLFLAEITENINREIDIRKRKKYGSSDKYAKNKAMQRYYRKMDKHYNIGA